MARLPRLYVPGMPQHVMLEAHASSGIDALFRDDDDLRHFGEVLRQSVRACGLAVHAYCLLPHAVHLLGTPADARTIARVVQSLGRRYVSPFNRRHQREGTLWRGRYRATVVDPLRHLLFFSGLIERLGSGAAMVNTATTSAITAEAAKAAKSAEAAATIAAFAPVEGPRRSSYAHHVGLAIDPVLTDHAVYWALGNTPFERQRVYREMLEQPVDLALSTAALAATRHGWPFGDVAFQEQCARLANRRTTPLSRGRPTSARPKATPEAQ